MMNFQQQYPQFGQMRGWMQQHPQMQQALQGRMQQRPPMQMPPRQGPPIMPQGGAQFGQLPPNMMPQMKPGLQPLPALASQGAAMAPNNGMVTAGMGMKPGGVQSGYKTY